MDVHELSSKLFRLAYKFRDAYQKRMSTQGLDGRTEELADMADTADKAYSFVSDAMFRTTEEERLKAEKQVLADQLEQTKQKLNEWESAYRYYADMAVHNKLEEVDQYLYKRTGRQPASDGQRINAFKEILEKQPQ